MLQNVADFNIRPVLFLRALRATGVLAWSDSRSDFPHHCKGDDVLIDFNGDKIIFTKEGQPLVAALVSAVLTSM
jgi:hypothetical protein